MMRLSRRDGFGLVGSGLTVPESKSELCCEEVPYGGELAGDEHSSSDRNRGDVTSDAGSDMLETENVGDRDPGEL